MSPNSKPESKYEEKKKKSNEGWWILMMQTNEARNQNLHKTNKNYILCT